MSAALEIERRVLARLEKGNTHSTAFKAVTRFVQDMAKRGLIRRYAVEPATIALWLEITDAGRARLAELRAMR